MKRKRQTDKKAEPFLDALQRRISSEVAVLRGLERDIDEADTDDEAPVAPRSSTARAGDDEPAMAQPLGDHAWVSEEAEAAAGLRARAKRERDKRRKARKRDAGRFSLAAVNVQMAAFVEGGAGAAADALELPSFSKLQRMQVCPSQTVVPAISISWTTRDDPMVERVDSFIPSALLQVRALACLYGLEARACGRAGQTLFRTGKCGPLNDERATQVCGSACGQGHAHHRLGVVSGFLQRGKVAGRKVEMSSNLHGLQRWPCIRQMAGCSFMLMCIVGIGWNPQHANHLQPCAGGAPAGVQHVAWQAHSGPEAPGGCGAVRGPRQPQAAHPGQQQGRGHAGAPGLERGQRTRRAGAGAH